jgi:hypothetical protein
MNEEEKKAIEKFVEKCNKFDESVEIKGISVGEEYRILETVCKVLDLAEKLQKENEKFKKERQIVGIPVRNKRDGRIGIVLHQWESGSVAVLESINPRVINTHDSWNTLEIVTDEVKDGNDTNVGSI